MGRDSARDRIARLTQAPALAHAQAPVQVPTHIPVHARAPVPTRPMVRLHCYVEQEQMAYLNRVSQAQGVDKAVFVRHIIDYYREHGPMKGE